MCAQENSAADIAKIVVLQVTGRPLSICVRTTAQSIQQVEAEGLKLSRTVSRYH